MLLLFLPVNSLICWSKLGSEHSLPIWPTYVKPFRNETVINYAFLQITTMCEVLRGILFIVSAGNDIIKADFMPFKRTNFPTKMKIGVHLKEIK